MSSSSPTSSNNALSTTVIEAVADKMDVAPTELPTQLYDVIDTESLDSLFSGGKPTGGRVTFAYCGYSVTVTADGDVTLEE